MLKKIFWIMSSIFILSSANAAFCAETTDETVISRSLEGQEMIFARKYDEAAKIFGDLKKSFPDSPAGDFGLMVLLEIKMLEREDTHLKTEFQILAKQGTAKVAQILQRYNPSTWDLFLGGSLLGMDGLFKARNDKWWDAYVAGTKSRQIFRRVKQMDPNFVDADFGLGMYIFWRSVFMGELPFLKMFPDKRKEGLAIVERVATEGKFAKNIAKANLAVMYFEEKRFVDAQKVLDDFVSRYPGNVILRTLLGKSLIAQKKYGEAIEQFKTILKIEPTLTKPHYFIGAVLVLAGNPTRFDDAQKELDLFIKMENGKYWPASAHYWLGKLEEARGNPEKAKAEYETAVQLNSKALEALKRIRALGNGV